MKLATGKGNEWSPTDFASYFDRAEVEIESDLGDWKAVRRELWKRSLRP